MDPACWSFVVPCLLALSSPCINEPSVCTLSVPFAGGAVPGDKDEIDFITIASTGDAADFGDLVAAAQYVSCCADSHGGLLG